MATLAVNVRSCTPATGQIIARTSAVQIVTDLNPPAEIYDVIAQANAFKANTARAGYVVTKTIDSTAGTATYAVRRVDGWIGQTATLRLRPDPDAGVPFAFVTPDDPAPYAAGDRLVLAVALTGAVETPTAYQWRKDGQDLVGATEATLTIEALSAADAGDYQCFVEIASVAIPSTTSTIAVTTGGES